MSKRLKSTSLSLFLLAQIGFVFCNILAISLWQNYQFRTTLLQDMYSQFDQLAVTYNCSLENDITCETRNINIETVRQQAPTAYDNYQQSPLLKEDVTVFDVNANTIKATLERQNEYMQQIKIILKPNAETSDLDTYQQALSERYHYFQNRLSPLYLLSVATLGVMAIAVICIIYGLIKRRISTASPISVKQQIEHNIKQHFFDTGIIVLLLYAAIQFFA